MAEKTNIEWADSTFNPWRGCTKVGPGCDNCYAEAQDKRFGGDHWGVGKERKRTTPAYWRNLRKWNAKASDFRDRMGRRQRVFIASQADVFDNAVSDSWRENLWCEIFDVPQLEIIIVTKRVGNVDKMAPLLGAFPPNVILLATVCNQAEADRDVPKLLALKNAGIVSRVGLSIEPMLGPMDIRQWLYAVGDDEDGIDQDRLDWVICGGESGPTARPMHPDWPRALRDQCAEAGVPFFFKQWGEWAPGEAIDDPQDRKTIGAWRFADQWRQRPVTVREGEEMHFDDEPDVWRVGKRRAGSLLDGREHKEFP